MNSLSRRQFLKGAAAGTVSLAATSLLGACSQNSESTQPVPKASAADECYEKSVTWDAEYDVIVVGYGAAGCSAAITAHDAGAKTLLLEKAPKGHEGGNSKYCGQCVVCPTDHDKAVTYYKGLRGGFSNMTDEMIEKLVSDGMKNSDWLVEVAGANKDKMGGFPWNEFPEIPGGESIFSALVDGEAWSGKVYRTLHNAVEKRGFDVWYQAPAYKLIQDPITRVIHGVTIKVNEKLYNVRAKNGVVMALGGFENNKEMIQSYVQMPIAYSKACRYNTGDGVTMCGAVGAALWHMSTMAGCDPNFVNPETNIAMAYYFTVANGAGFTTGFFAHEAILVGGDGTRYMNETDAPRHGHVLRHGTWISLPIPDNSWCIFDDQANTDGKPYPAFSDHCKDELEKGWVVKANTLEELADTIGIDAEGLAKQVAKYNAYCANGEDLDWGRNPKYLKPLTKAPYYAFRVYPTFTNTQGGAKRNVNMEVEDTYGQPIPHLYSAGEFGSFYADIYQGGSNLSECLVSGRTAGANAAVVKNDVTQENLLTANAIDFKADPDEEIKLEANQYLGVGIGIGGEVKVVVTYENGAITDVKVVRQDETIGYGTRAIASMPEQFIGIKSAEELDGIDNVSGATVTSKALKNAIIDALSQVK